MSTSEVNHVIRIITEYFLPYRGLTLDPDQDLSPDNVNIKLNAQYYFRILAQRKEPRGKRTWVFIYVLSNDASKTVNMPSKNKPKLVELIASAEGDAKFPLLDELLIIAPESFFTKKPLTDTMDMISQERGSKALDATGERPYYNAYPYSTFACNLPAHVEVPKHEIMTHDEVVKLMSFERIVYSYLQSILVTDPAVIWLGARVGQVIKITRISETTGTVIAYRRVQYTPKTMPQETITAAASTTT